MHISEAQNKVTAWAWANIPGATWQGITEHMKDEIVELNEHEHEINTEEGHKLASKELADIVILCCHFAGKFGIDLERAVAEKIEINKARSWSRPDPETGKIHHI